MSEYSVFTIIFAVFLSLAAVWLNHRISVNGERDSLSSWRGWQLSFMLRIGGLLVLFILLSFFQQSGSIDRHFFENLVLISFSIFVAGLVLDLVLSLIRLSDKKTDKDEHHKTTEGVKI